MKLTDWLIGSAALVSFALSVWLWFNNQKDAGVFVAIWVPSIIGFGIYWQLRKLEVQHGV